MYYYNKATQIKPDYFEAHHNKGNVYTKINDFVNAIKCYEDALKFKNDYLPSLKGASDIYIKQKNLKKQLLN